MNNEISKRLITAVIISLISILFIVASDFFLILFLIITFSVSIYEWKRLASNNYILLTGFIYLIFSFWCFYLLRDTNLSFLMFALLISIFSDIGGFIFFFFNNTANIEIKTPLNTLSLHDAIPI